MSNLRFLPLVVATCWLVAAPVRADDPIPPPPPLPLPQLSEELEPEVTIEQRGEDTVHEYRINGALYMVMVVPKAGPPYYLVDTDGDGSVDTRFSDRRQFQVPQWVLFRW